MIKAGLSRRRSGAVPEAAPGTPAADQPPPAAPAGAAVPGAADLERRVSQLCDSLRPVIANLLDAALRFDVSKGKDLDAACARAKSDFAGAVDEFFKSERAGLEEIANTWRLRDRMQYRQRLIEEIHETEEEYYKDLTLIESVWHAEVESSGLLAPQDVQLVFGSVPRLQAVSRDLSSALSREMRLQASEQCVGLVFLQRMPAMVQAYVDYCRNQVQGTEIVRNASKNPKFRDLVERLQFGHRMMRNLDLGAYLIKPTQRITKYPLFLADLVKYTDQTHKDYESLAKALEAMQAVLREVNVRTRERATLVFLVEKVLPTLTWRSAPWDLVASRSVLLKEGHAKLLITSKEDPAVREKASSGPPHSPSLPCIACAALNAGGLRAQGNRIIVFDNVVLACREKDEQWQELASFPTKGMVANVQTAAELTMFFQSPDDVRVWVGCLREAIDGALKSSQLRARPPPHARRPSLTSPAQPAAPESVKRTKKRESVVLYDYRAVMADSPAAAAGGDDEGAASSPDSAEDSEARTSPEASSEAPRKIPSVLAFATPLLQLRKFSAGAAPAAAPAKKQHRRSASLSKSSGCCDESAPLACAGAADEQQRGAKATATAAAAAQPMAASADSEVPPRTPTHARRASLPVKELAQQRKTPELSILSSAEGLGLTIIERAALYNAQVQQQGGGGERGRTHTICPVPRKYPDPVPANALAGASPTVRRVIDQHRKRSCSVGEPPELPASPALDPLDESFVRATSASPSLVSSSSSPHPARRRDVRNRGEATTTFI
eukprot:m51a1_g5122 putative domain containing protein (782) ;mRNA; r:379131-382225